MSEKLFSRYPLWFNDMEVGFVGSTDEKPVIQSAISEFLTRLDTSEMDEKTCALCADRNLRMLDVGSAAGVMGKLTADTLYDKTGNKVDYVGVDEQPGMGNIIPHVVQGDSIASAEFHHGNAAKIFEPLITATERAPYSGYEGEGLVSGKNRIDTKPDVILASHVMYYPDQTSETADISPAHGSVMNSMITEMVVDMPHNGLAMLVHEDHNPLNELKSKYADVVESDTTDKLETIFKPGISFRQGVTPAAHSVSFNSHIYFPELSDQEWKRLERAEDYSAEINPYGENKKLLNARILAEFAIHKPLEDLSAQDRSAYLKRLRKIVETAPIVDSGPYARNGAVHELTNRNQLIVRTHHTNQDLAEAVEEAISEMKEHPSDSLQSVAHAQAGTGSQTIADGTTR